MFWPRFLALETIRALGYEVRRVRPPQEASIDLRKADPVTLEYYLSQRGYVVLDIALGRARGFHPLGMPYDDLHHPFVRAFNRALKAGDEVSPRDAIMRELGNYYALAQPASALDLMQLSESEAPGLRDEPAFNYLLPWWERGVVETAASREKAIRQIAIRTGVKSRPRSGHPFFGPLHESRLDLQIERLTKLLESTRRDGFKPFIRQSPMKVTALRYGTDYRWLIEQGQHRAALAASLGLETVPAMLVSVVRREDAALWPQVISGVFSEAGALSLFDRIFDGQPPRVCSAWIEHAQSRSDKA